MQVLFNIYDFRMSKDSETENSGKLFLLYDNLNIFS